MPFNKGDIVSLRLNQFLNPTICTIPSNQPGFAYSYSKGKNGSNGTSTWHCMACTKLRRDNKAQGIANTFPIPFIKMVEDGAESYRFDSNPLTPTCAHSCLHDTQESIDVMQRKRMAKLDCRSRTGTTARTVYNDMRLDIARHNPEVMENELDMPLGPFSSNRAGISRALNLEYIHNDERIYQARDTLRDNLQEWAIGGLDNQFPGFDRTNILVNVALRYLSRTSHYLGIH